MRVLKFKHERKERKTLYICSSRLDITLFLIVKAILWRKSIVRLHCLTTQDSIITFLPSHTVHDDGHVVTITFYKRSKLSME